MRDVFEIIRHVREVEQENAEAIRKNKRQAPILRALNRLLLGIGGQTVAFYGGYLGFMDFDLIKAVVRRGQEFPADGAIMMPGEPFRCHENVDAMWHKNKNAMKVVTGFSLVVAIGVWEMHSWGWHVKKPCVIETTERRDAYFGFFMTAREIKNCRVMP